MSALNPFAGIGFLLDPEILDAEAQLPSPWSTVLSHALHSQGDLDLLQQNRARKAAFWRSEGALKAMSLAAVALVLIAVSLRIWHNGKLSTSITELRDTPGLVTQAERDQEVVDQAEQAIKDNQDRLAFLAHQRQPGHISAELIRVIGNIQDPNSMPVYIKGIACNLHEDGFPLN